MENGAYQVTNVKTESKALDVLSGCGGQNGCKLQLFSKSSADAGQQWFFLRVE
jgi:hypothetical protein